MRYLIGIAFFLVACNGRLESVQKPADLLTEQQMQAVLTDLMLLEGHINLKYETVNRFHKIMNVSGKQVLKENHITQKQYEESFTYYYGHPELMERILDNVLDGFTKESLYLQQELKDTLQKRVQFNDTLSLPPSLGH